MKYNIKSKQYLLRKKILEFYYNNNAGHIGCSLSCIDIIIAIFYNLKKENDVFLLSKGHAACAIYSVLNDLGEISDTEMSTYYENGTQLPAHPAPNKFKSIPFATGSLGHGFPLSAGIAKAKKLKTYSEENVFCLMSDGETNEGTTWEAAHFSVSNQLDNLIIIIDKNNIQGFGYTKDVFGDTSDKKKWDAIGFEVIESDGHNIEELQYNLSKTILDKNKKPKLIIANTVKGKGVSFMENTIDWHYLPMSEDQYKIALQEINSKYNA